MSPRARARACALAAKYRDEMALGEPRERRDLQ
jgi:hypothetical protein